MNPLFLSISDYTYTLPADRIAHHPLPARDEARLLIWNNHQISEDKFKHLATHLPSHSLLVLNNTRVIPARVLFKKPTGGIIELFCLEPDDSNEYNLVMDKQGGSRWKCMIGGAGKWKSGPLHRMLTINDEQVDLSVTLVSKESDAYIAAFSWFPEKYSFANILEAAGEMPLPPYIKRKIENEDSERYQTVYAHNEGSVAAPTAGLHFTENMMAALKANKISTDFVTLHVGAGTFKPVKATQMADHEMHAEWMDVSVITIKKLIEYSGNITVVGTTSLRTVESLYWMGVKCSMNSFIQIEELAIRQWEVYTEPLLTNNVDVEKALPCLLSWMENNNLERLLIQTSILIAPGYIFRMINALITNFHQPQSTLLLLVAAIAGQEWRTIYDYALENDFRFLSYGDGSLLFLDRNRGTNRNVAI